MSILKFVVLAILLAFLTTNCSTPKRGCKNNSGIIGVSHCPTIPEAKKSKNIFYTYDPRTGYVQIVDKKGNIVCCYYTKPNVKDYMIKI